jgi:DNA-binding response OmpR family regulator
MKHRILVIEDDAAIRRGVVDALRFDGYDVEQAGDRATGQPMAVKADAALLLLDLVLPDGSGLDILREVRATRPLLPVIIMTAKGTESDRVAGLKLGADDYVVKPFSVLELLARVEAVLRRSAERPTDVRTLRIDNTTIDLDRREVRFSDGAREELSEREVELLRYLAANAGRAIAREEILARVWRINPRAIVQTRTIDMHVTALRGKLRDDPADPRIILTVRGKGYMFGTATEATP